VFFDRDRLLGGLPLLASLEGQVQRSRLGVLVVTTAALSSEWVGVELEEMTRCHYAGWLRLVAVCRDAGCPAPTDRPWHCVLDHVVAADPESAARRIWEISRG
jgi:hypothetical protein